MKPLSETQGDFASAISDPEAPIPFPVTSHASDTPTKRFNVYRNNVYSSLSGVLEGKFPAVARLVGPRLFAAISRAFIDAHPPRSPVLMEYGDAFAGFLEQFKPVAGLLYLPDVARIEWAWNLSYYAADAEPVDPDSLQDLPQEKIADARFELHPSMSVVCSDFPVITIWEANVDDDEPDVIDAGVGGEDALIIRPHTNVEVRRLPVGGAAFIETLSKGSTLAQAAQTGVAASEEFDVTTNLAGLFQSGAVTAVNIS